MASGLPAVSARWKTIEEISSPALLAENKDDFIDKINEALKICQEDRDNFIKFARENSWKKRFELVMKYFEKSQ